MFFRKTRFIKVKRMPEEKTVLDVDSLDTLKRDFDPIFETDNCFFTADYDTVYRVRKKGFKPTVRKVEKISYQPMDTQIFLSRKALFDMAADLGFTIWETADAYLVFGASMVLVCEKKKKVRG